MPKSKTVRPRDLRLAVVALLVVLATAISLIATGSSGQATSGGSPYAAPAVTDTNPDPDVVETTLTSETAMVDIGNGVTAKAQTYNGSLPGPTFHLKVGDTVVVHYVNKLAKPSAIHWHGIELPNGMDGTPFTQNQVPPNGTFLYKFKVTRPGLYWYHPHHHSSTNQVFKGLYGMIVVEDPNENALRASGVLPPQSQTLPIALSDATVCKAAPNNDASTYTTGPHVSGAALPAQQAPFPKTLCEAPTAINEDGLPQPSYAAGDIPAIQTLVTHGATNEGQTVLTNGRNVGARAATQGVAPTSTITPGALAAGASKLDVRSGQGLRLQLVNTATIRYMRLRLTTSTGTLVPLVRIGGEGGLLTNAVVEGGVSGGFDSAYTAGEILLPPGTRADVVAAIPTGLAVNSVLTMWTEDYLRTGGGYSNLPTVPVMHLNVTGAAATPYTIAAGAPLRAATGDPVPTLGPATGSLLNPATFTPAKLGLAAQNVQLTAIANDSLGVDNVFGTHDVAGDYSNALHLGSSRYAKEGDILELTVQNTTGARHPFHLHGFSIQPINLTRPANPTYTWPYKEFRDNVDIPPNYTLRFRVKLEARPLPDGTTPGGAEGRWVFHCHIFFHATNGMLGELVVASATGKERPDVNVNGTAVQVSQGQTATIKGTYADRDGGPVALTASKGTVSDDGGGNWTWTYPTAAADSSQFVYVTATDNTGLRSQMPFNLLIDNTPPTLVLPGAQTATVGAATTFGVSATDPDAVDPIALTATGLPAGLTFTDHGNRTGTVSGTPTTVGASTITFSASDGKHPAVAGTVPITVGPVKPPPFIVVLDRPERLVKKAITVGCRLDEATMQSCRADVLVGTKRVGSATTTLKATGKAGADVRVTIAKSTRSKIAHSLGGQPVTVRGSARRFGAPDTRTASATTTVVAPRVVSVATKATFAARSAKLTKRGKAYLKGVAKKVRTARRVTCTAYPDSGLRTATGRKLAKARARAACKALAKAGLSAKTTSVGAKRAASKSRSARSQDRNRRVRITISR